MMKHKLHWFMLLILIALFSSQLLAQSPPVITMSVPSFWQMIFDEAILADFEAQHGVDVQLIFDAPAPTLPDQFDQEGIMKWQTSLVDYAQSADVLFVDNEILSVEASRAGVVLDLSPLIQSDPTMNPDDFYPTIWDSFHWDDSQWALPIGGRTTLVEYIPSAFDDKGLVYPDANWSIAEFATAVRDLAEFDESGEVTLPGMLIGLEDRTTLFYSLIGADFASDAQPDMPTFASEALIPLFETWQKLESEGVIASDPTAYLQRLSEIPLKVGGGGVFAVSVTIDDGETQTEDVEATGFGSPASNIQTALALLPNHVGAVSGQGFAISSGTPNPQLAYDLVRYLSERPEIADLAFGAEPARRTYLAPEIESDDTGMIIMAVGGGNRSEADLALIQRTLEAGISGSDLRFGHYLTHVDGKIASGFDILTALQTVEADANRAVSQMMESDLTIIVNTPDEVVLGEGEILLNFGLASPIQPLPNADQWDGLVQAFADLDPEVGFVNINSGFMRPNQMLRENDCVYQPTTTGLFELDTSQLLPIDPLVNADLDYNINDLPPNILQQMQFNGATYGLPLTLQPEVLTYNPKSFASAAITPPVDGWDIAEFESALRLLDDALNEDVYPLEAISPINTYLLMLIAAQGGQLFDTSMNPVAIDFSSPESVAAVQYVLDLVKDDLIQYERLGDSDGFDFVAIGGDAFSNIRASNFFGILNADTRIAPYPDGTQYIPVSLSVGAGFIGIDSTYPEACYRWLSFLANHPFAFTDMPALISTLDDPLAEASYGTDTLATYRQIAEQATHPNAVNPIVWDPFIMIWLNRAFDAYVFDSAELEAGLADAEQTTQAYIDCISQPLAADATQDSIFEQIETCGQQLISQ